MKTLILSQNDITFCEKSSDNINRMLSILKNKIYITSFRLKDLGLYHFNHVYKPNDNILSNHIQQFPQYLSKVWRLTFWLSI